jgi:adenosyl cobinamide kinase/adenosyl cobinamide phosphate guanylyltransferase
LKVGGGLNYVVGPMGAGKSLYGVRKIVAALTAGKYAITNVELREDAFDRIAGHIVFGRPWTWRKRRRISDKLRAHYVFETDLAQAVRYRVPGTGEARALFVWDETHNDLNNRNWRERAAAHKNERGTDSLLEWATQLRKLGFVGYLLSQHHENTDAALRRVCSYLIRMQNQKESTRMLGMRITPWPLFLAAWYPTNTPLVEKMKPMQVERYFLGWHRHLYDTLGLYHGLALLDDTSDVELLPVGGRALPGAAGKPAISEAPQPVFVPGTHRDLAALLNPPVPDA